MGLLAPGLKRKLPRQEGACLLVVAALLGQVGERAM
jgi:hypothetical protein